MIEEGADILDLGAYSSRPGADDISAEEEWYRLEPALEIIRKRLPGIPLSVDTFRAQIVKKAQAYQVEMVNDISGGNDPDMYTTVAQNDMAYVLMHMRGTPQTMKSLSTYDNILTEIFSYFKERLDRARNQGIKDIILDPGFGFAKNIEQNYFLLDNLHYFRSLGCPILAGFSRKSMIYKKLNISAAEALNGTTVLNTIALIKGASILRVHDVKQAVEVKHLTEIIH